MSEFRRNVAMAIMGGLMAYFRPGITWAHAGEVLAVAIFLMIAIPIKRTPPHTEEETL